MRLHQITDDDLATLERLIPEMFERCMDKIDDNASRVKVRQIQQIIVNVRWNYGPWSDVTVIPCDTPPGAGGGG